MLIILIGLFFFWVMVVFAIASIVLGKLAGLALSLFGMGLAVYCIWEQLHSEPA